MCVEWYATIIDITWGNPVPFNTGDYQQRTTPLDSGKILIGGDDSGIFNAAVIGGTGVPSSNTVLSLSNTKKVS